MNEILNLLTSAFLIYNKKRLNKIFFNFNLNFKNTKKSIYSNTKKNINKKMPPKRRKTPIKRNKGVKKTTNKKKFTKTQKSQNVLKKKELFLPTINKGFEKELKLLQECYIPKVLLFRENEEKKIKSFLKSGIENKGSQTSMYITGMPGLGKSACCLKVIKNLKEIYDDKFEFIYINALKLKSPNMFYTQLWMDLTGDSCSSSNNANLYLEKLFKTNKLPDNLIVEKDIWKRLKKPKILIIDEIDFLWTRNQNVFYNIFDWQHFPYSYLITISIANTLDFPDRILSKIQSRMGKNRLIFKTYYHSEIEQIIKKRLEGSKVFNPKTIEFIAKKSASFSSDIRKSLQICRKCLHAFVTYNNENTKKLKSITIDFVTNIFDKEFLKPIIVYLRNCSKITKIFYIAVLYEFHNNPVKFIDSYFLFKRINILLTNIGEKPIDSSIYNLLIEKAIDNRILSFVNGLNERNKILLYSEADDISFGLSDDDIFQKFGHLSSVLI